MELALIGGLAALGYYTNTRISTNNEKIKNINYFLNEAYDKIVLNNTESFNLNNSDESLLTRLIKILNQEKMRLGSLDADLIVENVKYRIENELWD